MSITPTARDEQLRVQSDREFRLQVAQYSSSAPITADTCLVKIYAERGLVHPYDICGSCDGLAKTCKHHDPLAKTRKPVS